MDRGRWTADGVGTCPPAHGVIDSGTGSDGAGMLIGAREGSMADPGKRGASHTLTTAAAAAPTRPHSPPAPTNTPAEADGTPLIATTGARHHCLRHERLPVFGKLPVVGLVPQRRVVRIPTTASTVVGILTTARTLPQTVTPVLVSHWDMVLLPEFGAQMARTAAGQSSPSYDPDIRMMSQRLSRSCCRVRSLCFPAVGNQELGEIVEPGVNGAPRLVG